MGRNKRTKIPFDNRSGVIMMCRFMLESEAYKALTPHAKSLMTLLQLHWRDDKWVDYGIREAAAKISCDRKTAIKAFKQLEDKGFITCMAQSVFNSRTQSKSRSWRLEWLPFDSHFHPTQTKWEQWAIEN